MKLLLTAFDPFGGDAINPALEAVKLVADKIGRFDIVKLEVPTVFRKSIDTVAKAIEEEKPDVVLCIGQAGGRFEITPERVAINVDDARIKDNEGNQPIDIKIFEDGENAYFTTLPIKAMVEAIREANLPAAVSNTAGTFVCNHLMYGVLYTLAKKYPHIKGGFTHVPFIPAQVARRTPVAPYMALEDIKRGLEAAIAAIDKNFDADINVNGGKEF
ncbi:MAG: pyroglutamyl-peptidase I [Lachnoanaerobaculum sp.]|jgi:pyroglutamyl-peptidase I|uniref:pyroglutamyl-peptidase I n=1 Tax=Lachnoanaerobaculum sp. ICM7 TaxID=936594 RepID=UPI0005592B42|nr:pyroglutamyl-peptidase I [Lachnoanaerobaculum sp. ICM7]MBB1548127.1 pyroglutamyl-peptidase I [Mogibacterium sp.]MBF1011322.1 pyroglutamyl-peptidase I [Lachnoanaerobaculum sp.]MBF1259935.1 pyroglutamyl-peptidase I [Lachnoanaerobaculum sp.]